MNIKTLICGVVALSIVSGAYAQSQDTKKFDIHVFGSDKPKNDPQKPRSVAYSVSGQSASFLYLRDGVNASALAVDYPVFQVSGLDNRLTIDAIGSYLGDKQVYLGGGLNFKVYENHGWKLSAIAGYKGFNVSHGFDFQSGKSGFVWGFGLTIPFVNS